MDQQEWLMEKNDNIFATHDMEGTIFKKSETKTFTSTTQKANKVEKLEYLVTLKIHKKRKR
jgi:hypothetical protein